jgi:hypothetical protein
MKKVIAFLLSLTCLAAHAQYHKTRASQSHNQLTSLSYYGSTKVDLSPKAPAIKLPMFLTTASSTSHSGYTTYNGSTATTATNQGYWTGTKMTTSSANGRFQAVQSFDISGNLRESKATFQFPKRKH